MPEVLCSIVVPVFNRRNFLHRCVTSLQKLHLSSYEIILVDDGSQNETRVACDQYASDDARIHVIHQENQGVVVARAAGWKASEGKYIAFVDSDDWLDTDSYTGLLQQMEEHASIDIGIPRLILEYEDGSSQDMFSEHEKRVLDPKECAREIFLEQKSFCWEVGKIYRRTILDHWKPDSIAYPREDLDMFWKMLRISRKVQYDGTAIYHYRIHPQNSHTIDILQQDGMRSLLHVWRDIHVDSDIDLKQNVCQRILLATLERIYARYFSGRVDTNMDEVRQEIDLLRHIYHMMPDRTQAPALAKIAYKDGWNGIDYCYQNFFSSMKRSIQVSLPFRFVYVYGTGGVSEWLSKIMVQEGHPFIAYVVSNHQVKKDNFHDHEVKYLSEIPQDVQNTAFILALAEWNCKEVVKNLHALGFKNVFSFSTYPIFEHRRFLKTRY